MTLTEMHVWFRQYAQQMGMQNVRAILPEQIDLLINTSIIDTVNQIIRENVGITNDRVITDNSKIGQINALRTLYKVEEIDLCPKEVDATSKNNPDKRIFSFEKSNRKTGKLTTNFNVSARNSDAKVYRSYMPKYLYLVDFSISYRITTTGLNGIPDASDETFYEQPSFDDNSLETNYFPVRIIDDAYLADTLNDFVLKNRLRSPIIVTYNDGIFDLYIEEFIAKIIGNKTYYTLNHNLVPYKLRMSYLSSPAKVEYKSDISDEDNVNCDLPDYMHVDILKHAVDLYRMSVAGALSTTQQQGQTQQQEDTRNNYRNEGFQQ